MDSKTKILIVFQLLKAPDHIDVSFFLQDVHFKL